ncbi:uncharacterized protein LOC133836225 [Drosophila sulfurigaster albostrigata]|uniref:uncharacterized protein LOC133836225 n=1 Tax=Drosophila sulfurigaster albostrigata TaxID=89887 RepID=UPI002D219886|nr:uncharacterized protein LOC133836225 [Drosophila sulfurigaster albostrigata]
MGISKSTRNQFLAALSVNLLSVSFGANFGLITAYFPRMLSHDKLLADVDNINNVDNIYDVDNITDVDNIYDVDNIDDVGNIDVDQIQEFLNLYLALGAVIGAIVFGWMAEKFGRRRCLLLMVIPAMLSWLLIILIKDWRYLWIERIIAGSVGGCCYAVIPVYITEMAEDRFRGILGTFMPLGMTIGMSIIHLLELMIGNWLAACIMIVIDVAFLRILLFIPDSPEYLQRYNKKEVEKSLRYFRGISPSEDAQYQVELAKLSTFCETLENGVHRDENNLPVTNVSNQKALKAFIIGFGVILAKLLTGYYNMHQLSKFYFTNALDGHILVIIAQLLGTFSATLLVERVGRKPLLLNSTAGVGVGLVLILYKNRFEPSNYEGGYLLTIYLGAIGITTLDFVISTEITPPKKRSLALRVQIALSILMYPIFYKLPRVMEKLLIQADFLFANFSMLLTILFALYLPETKGKSIAEIQASLE